MREGFGIGELAARCEVSADTIRFYEREGLLPHPRRSRAGYRIFSEQDEQRLRFVRQAQSSGLTLEDVREIVRQREARTPDQCRRVAALLGRRIGAIDRKLAQLRAFRRLLAASLEQCRRASADACPLVLDLSRVASRTRKEAK